jgi:general secretion pathway protein D
VVSVSEGEFLKQGGGATSFSHRVDQATGQVFGTVSRTGAGGATGAGALLNVTFKALAPSPEARASVLMLSAIGLGGKTVTVAMPPARGIVVAP